MHAAVPEHEYVTLWTAVDIAHNASMLLGYKMVLTAKFKELLT